MFKIGSQLFTAAARKPFGKLPRLAGHLPGPQISRHSKHRRRRDSVLRRDARSTARKRACPRGHAMVHAAAQAISAVQPMGADRSRLLAVPSSPAWIRSYARSWPRRHVAGPRAETRAASQEIRSRRCSSLRQEARAIRKACGRDFLIVTPGVRPKEKAAAPGRRPSSHRHACRSIRAGAISS